MSKPASHRQQAAKDGRGRIRDVVEVAQIRHHDGGVEVGVGGGLAVGFVALLELGDRAGFVAEHLDHLQPVDHLLDVTVDAAQVLLLAWK